MRQVQVHRIPPSVSTDVEEIHDWMPVPYISKVYRVPEPYLYQKIGIKHGAHRKESLAELNHIYFPDQPGLVLKRTKIAVLNFQQEHLPPGRRRTWLEDNRANLTIRYEKYDWGLNSY